MSAYGEGAQKSDHLAAGGLDAETRLDDDMSPSSLFRVWHLFAHDG
jgi:hypothetical protein